MLFFSCVVISNLYLFLDIIDLNPYFNFCYFDVLSIHSNLYTIKQILIQLMKCKSRDLQLLLKYLSGIVNSMSKDGTAWSTSPDF